MKIATLTLPLHTNYGGNLQAFALHNVLVKLGHEPILLDFRKRAEKKHIIRKVGSKVKKLFFSQKSNNGMFHFSAAENNFINAFHREFIDNYINKSNPLYNEVELKRFVSKNNLGAVIVGSDQVWRPKYTPHIDPFFLSFLNGNTTTKKISYAASFGVDSWEFTSEELSVCKKLIQQFDSVSVRESLGVEMCESFFSIHAEHVLDPTLLLDRDDYISVFNRKKLPNNTGKIFSYILDSDGDKNEFMNEVSRSLNKKVFTTYPSKHIKTEARISNMSEFQYPSIEAWLKSFYDADFVVTDSFHGTVFSILFNKPFISICNKDRGSARFQSLLAEFSLEERLVHDVTEVDVELLNTPIDFSLVNAKLEFLRKKSLQFLSDSLIN
ncbi:TPA: polysaccharide pyruvyl transferase family protein [Raoultella planticola]